MTSQARIIKASNRKSFWTEGLWIHISPGKIKMKITENSKCSEELKKMSPFLSLKNIFQSSDRKP